MAIKVGVFPYQMRTSECAVRFETLTPTKRCPDVGLTANLLGIMLDMANVSYEVVPLNFSESFGKFDGASGEWSGSLINDA